MSNNNFGMMMGLTLPNGQRVEAHLAMWIIAVIKVMGPDKFAQVGSMVAQLNATQQTVPIVGGQQKLSV
jgi:hypothetical protein